MSKSKSEDGRSMSESEDERPISESEMEDERPMSESKSEDDRRPTDDIPSIVPDPEAPLRGEDVPDDWLNQRQPTPSGRPGGW